MDMDLMFPLISRGRMAPARSDKAPPSANSFPVSAPINVALALYSS